MATNADLMTRRHQAVPRGVGNIHSIFAANAENAEVWDVEGRRFIDFASGIAVVNTGHRHPRVVAAVQEQMERFTHTCFHVMPYLPYVALAERLNTLSPGTHAKKTFFVNTGAEAVENAIKIARAYTGRSAVISFNGAFHGRTLAALGLTGKILPYKAGFGPFQSEVYHAPFPNPLHDMSVEQALAGLQQLFKSDVEASRVAAIFVEPVQGEGGFYPAPVQFLQRLRAICDEHGIVLVADEVQTGIGRTGRLFAMEHSEVVPDLITLAKGLGGGFPLASVTGRAEIMDAANPGALGSTYGGNPLSCAAAMAVLDVMEEDALPQRSAELGERMQARLRALADRMTCIGDVRGLGCMVAMELFKDRARTRPDAELTQSMVARAAEKGLIMLPCGVYGNVIRILVPLTVSDEVIDEGLDIIEDCLMELTALEEAV
jgi:4-aminobutyrate aminotransferase